MKLLLITAISVALVSGALARIADADEQEITIESFSTIGKAVLAVKATSRGKTVELTCFLTDRHCRIPKPGKYSIVQVGGPYTDCENVSLYRVSGRADREEVGVYCLLGSEDCGLGECAKVSVPLIISEVPDRIPENSKH